MKLEIKRAIFNRYFVFVCFLGTLVSLLHCYQVLIPYNDFFSKSETIINASDIQYNPLAEITSVFTMWIGFDRTNILAKRFFLFLPLLSVTPFCWSYCNELKNGYADKFVAQIGRYNYHLNKYVSIFISSGLTIAIPLVINFLIMLLFVPAIKPDSVYDIYYGIFSNNFMADAFYNAPMIYVLTFVLIDFIFCGLFGCVGYAVSTILRSRIISVVSPIALLLAIEFLNKKLIEKGLLFKMIFSPLSFLCPFQSFKTNWTVIIIEMLIMLFLTFFFSVLRFRICDFKHKKEDVKYEEE